MLTDEELDDAKRLAKRFKDVKNRAGFAREFGVPGGGAMIYQHIKALKPISLEAGKAYAKGFDVSLNEISERLAKQIEHASVYIHHTPGAGKSAQIREVLPKNRPVLLLSDNSKSAVDDAEFKGYASEYSATADRLVQQILAVDREGRLTNNLATAIEMMLSVPEIEQAKGAAITEEEAHDALLVIAGKLKGKMPKPTLLLEMFDVVVQTQREEKPTFGRITNKISEENALNAEQQPRAKSSTQQT